MPIVGLAVVAGFVLLFILWRWTPLAEWVEPRELVKMARSYATGNPIWLVVLSVFIGVANVFMVPINLMLFAVAVAFPGWKGFVCGMLGAQIGALIEYVIGRTLGMSRAKKRFGEKFEDVSEEIKTNGLPTLIFLGLVPIAPAAIVNTIAGFCRVSYWKIFVATFVAFTPGLVVMNLLSRQMRRMIREPSVGALVAIIGLIAFIAFAIHFARGYRQRHESRKGDANQPPDRRLTKSLSAERSDLVTTDPGSRVERSDAYPSTLS